MKKTLTETPEETPKVAPTEPAETPTEPEGTPKVALTEIAEVTPKDGGPADGILADVAKFCGKISTLKKPTDVFASLDSLKKELTSLQIKTDTEFFLCAVGDLESRRDPAEREELIKEARGYCESLNKEILKNTKPVTFKNETGATLYFDGVPVAAGESAPLLAIFSSGRCGGLSAFFKGHILSDRFAAKDGNIIFA